MKKFLIIAWTIFAIGLVFRLLHYPGTGPLSLLGTLLILIHSIIYLCKNAKTDLPGSFLRLSVAFITIFVLFRFQYWPGGPGIAGFPLLFLVTFFLTLAWIVLHFALKSKFGIPQLFLVLYFVFFLTLSFVRSDRIYYFFNLNTTLNGDSRNTNYYSWDKYSWFLYIAGKPEEALEANLNAQQALEKAMSIGYDEDAPEYLIFIPQHKQAIEDRNWKNYP